MGACTSGPTPRGVLTEEQRAMQMQMLYDLQMEQEREVAMRLNREKMALREKAMPMIMMRSSVDEILDLDVHSDAEFEEVIKTHRSRSNSDINSDLNLSDSASVGDSEMGAGTSGPDESTSPQDGKGSDKISDKVKILEQVKSHFKQDENESIAVLRANKQMKRRRAKQDAEGENKWMIFRDLDAFDEADMVKVAKFMENLFKIKGKLENDESKNAALLALGALEAESDEHLPSLPERRYSEDTGLLQSPPPAPSTATRSPGSKSGNKISLSRTKDLSDANIDLQNFRLPSGFVTPLVSKTVVDVFKQGGRLSKESVHKLLRLCYRSFQTLPNTTRVSLGEDERLTVIGDIHGQLADLLYIISQSGLPNAKNKYIFNGDFVDRGPFGVEVMCILMALYLSNPGQVTLNRGNHEEYAICCAYGFQAECCSKYDDVTFGMFIEVFNHLPLFTLVNERIFVLHGGLFHTADDLPDGGDDYLKQLQRDALWSDPSCNMGLNASNRGAGVMFGPDIARSFCETNNISLVVRSHECCRTGFDLPYANSIDATDRNLVCTIFSASNYGGGGNSAAYMVFTRQSPELENHIKTSVAEVPDTDMIYRVHYFHIDDGESDAAWIHAASDTSLMGDLSLHQLILRKRSLLLKHFELADPSMTGYVLKETWAEVMQLVLSLHISWMTMFSALIDDDLEGTTPFVFDSLYAHHNELSAIFSFFDMKEDQVISRAEFKAGCTITEEEKLKADKEFDEECDNLMDIMNLNGSGFIDINEFFEMFRVSDAMQRRTLKDAPANRLGRRGSMQKGVTVSGVFVSGE
eukprot:GSChrysophyteH1.ASY1.ANO1.497.1 assembled CDS